jgi:hypothetical protein
MKDLPFPWPSALSPRPYFFRGVVSCAAIGFGGRFTCGRGREVEAGRAVMESFGSVRESDTVVRATRGLPTLGERIAPS